MFVLSELFIRVLSKEVNLYSTYTWIWLVALVGAAIAAGVWYNANRHKSAGYKNWFNE